MSNTVKLTRGPAGSTALSNNSEAAGNNKGQNDTIEALSFCPSTLKMLDPLHHLGLRLAAGAFRTSTILSLYAETNEWSLERRRVFLSATYILRVRILSDHFVSEAVMTEQCERTFRNKPSIFPTLSVRVKTTANENNFDINSLILQVHRHLAPWLSRLVECDLTLTKYNKAVSSKAILQEFLKLKCRCGKYAQFFRLL